MTPVLQWIKSNVYVVIFVVLMLAAAISMPIVSGKLNARVKSKVAERVKLKGELQRLERTDFTQPGETESRKILVNERFLEKYRQVVDRRNEDAEAVYEAALEHNGRGRGVLVPELLPEPPLARGEVLRIDFFNVLGEAFENLLVDINAGAPPAPREVRTALERKQAALLNQEFFTDTVDTLTEDQKAILTERLIEARTVAYVQEAERLSLYASLDGLVLPPTDGSYLPSLTEIYDWQWTYWIVEDIALALARANVDATSVIHAPVKRVISINVDGGPLLGGGAAQDDNRRTPAQPTPLNPKAPATLDFSVTLTGRQSNPLYDVRYVDLSLIIDARQLPGILDALAAQNFITAVDIDLSPADAFEAAGQGYFYGAGQISRLDMKIETIWLRQWMIPFMPQEVRDALSIAVPQKPAAG